MKKYITYIIFSFIFMTSLPGFSQQDPLYSQYYNNPLSINPAYAGSRGNINVVALHRRQWTGFEKAPVTSTISFNKSTPKNKVGYGFSFINDNLGPVAQNGLYVDYAYHLQLTNTVNLSFGLKGGFNHYKFNLNTLAANHPDDPIIINGEKTMFLPNLGFGTYLYAKNFAFGFAIPKLLQNSLTDDENSLDYLSKEERHYFFTGAALFNIAENIRFRPSFISRVVLNSPVSIDLNAQFIFAEKLWAGAAYRLNDSFGGNLQFQINSTMRIGYSYDFSTSWLRPYNNGTHEVALVFDFNLKGIEYNNIKYF